tara:strand:- start:1640 stop:1849 length:210 start_codon:yes stop_codon:yes gene_type:complete
MKSPMPILIGSVLEEYASADPLLKKGTGNLPTMETIAYPSAAGAAKFTKDSRGGGVYHLIILKDSGPGA